MPPSEPCEHCAALVSGQTDDPKPHRWLTEVPAESENTIRRHCVLCKSFLTGELEGNSLRWK
jgi:hypothetical protein